MKTASQGCINNEPVDYKSLPKSKKLAIFLIAVGPEVASQVLNQFEDSEIEFFCREIANMKIVDFDIKNEALEDFTNLIAGSLGSIVGGINFAQKALGMSRFSSQSESILGKIAPGGSDSDLMQKICELEPLQIYNLFSNEQTQTLAYIMSNLNIEKSAKLVVMLDEGKRQQVLEKIGDMKEASVEMVARIATVIKPQLKDPDTQNVKKSDGVRFVADMLNIINKDIGKEFLAKLSESNAGLSAAISKKMFSFEDLLSLNAPDLQRITREVEMNDLVVALKGASKALEEAIMKSVSKRAAESLKDELTMLGPVKVKAVEEAQSRIIQVVKRLEEDGSIEIGQDGGDVIE